LCGPQSTSLIGPGARLERGDRRAQACTLRYVLRAPRSRQLDATGCGASFLHRGDPAARSIFLRLTQEFPRVRGHVFGAFRKSALLRGSGGEVHALLRETATAAAAREWRESAGPHRMTRREPPTFPSSAAAGAAPPRLPVLASGCHGRTSRGG
jgi:hypothetical protein